MKFIIDQAKREFLLSQIDVVVGKRAMFCLLLLRLLRAVRMMALRAASTTNEVSSEASVQLEKALIPSCYKNTLSFSGG